MAFSFDRAVDLLLTDVGTPDMNGRERLDRLACRFPGLRRRCMTGYTNDVTACGGVLEKGNQFIQIPFSVSGRASVVGAVLERDDADN